LQNRSVCKLQKNENTILVKQQRANWFYGMDIQIGEKLIKKYVNMSLRNYNRWKSLTVADSCANKKIDFSKLESWWQIQVQNYTNWSRKYWIQIKKVMILKQ
jgi:hypothetical protein